ncbi:MAG: DNA repair exonuclease [bacterium]|nr:DNA repair exonuclease [Acidimicrobiia bacterium]MCY4648913.1 DNA repair exonuclease [bacterium]
MSVMVRFLHTADWQIGMTRYYLEGEAQSRFSQARIDVIRRIGSLAAEERCRFVLVCGDVFESNQVERDIVIRALEAMAETPQIPFYLLPGNHDPLDASTVYRSPTFNDKRPPNVVVLNGLAPVEAAPGVELIAAPWPSKDPRADLTNRACDGLGATDGIRIVVGHGQVDRFAHSHHHPARVELEVLEGKLEAGLIHYVALGDRHSKTEAGSTGRVWYSGAPEPTNFRETDPGHVLVVSLGRDWVDVEGRLVAAWRFLSREWEVVDDSDLDSIDEWLSGMRPKERTVIRTSVAGRVTLQQRARLSDLIADHRDPMAFLGVDYQALVTSADAADIEALGVSGFARKAVQDLGELADEGDNAQVARDALVLLQRLIGENR